MNWIDELPDKCPPKEATNPDNFTVYRLATQEQIDEVDFQSQRALKPLAKFRGVSECLTRSLSVFSDVEKCQNMVKLPVYKGRWKMVLQLQLNEDDGMIQKTFKDPKHYSWWRTSNFNINNSVIIQNE